MNPALQKILEDLSKRGQLVRAGKGWLAPCPAHDDSKQSLSVGEGKDGKVLLHDFAGCTVPAICEAAGWNMAELFPDSPRSSAMNVVATYAYRDEMGVLLNEVLRLEPKSFRQRRPDGAGGWVYNLEGVRRVLYRLPELKKKKAILLAEGEKDVDALWDLKLPATTSLGGASTWRDEYAQQLVAAGVKRVAILPDNDDAGRRYAHAAAAALHAAGLRVRVVALPALPPKGDVSDFLAAAEHPRGDLIRELQAGEYWTPESAPPPDEPSPRGWRKGTDLDKTPIRYLVDKMVPKGMLGSISGRDRRGKSLLGLEIAKAVLLGEPLFGEFKVNEGKPGTVFMLLLDDPEFLISDRLEKMGILNHPNLYLKTRRDVDEVIKEGKSVEFLTLLAEEFKELKPTFVLIDALYIFIPEGKGGRDLQNSGSAMKPIMQAFDEVCNQSPDTTVGVVIHNNKADIDLSGSQTIRNMLKWILILALPKKYEKDIQGGRITPDRILQLDKMKTGESAQWGLRIVGIPGQGVRWEQVPIEELEISDKKQAKADRAAKIVEWLSFFLVDGPKTSQEVREGGWGDGQRFGWKDIEAAADVVGVEKISQGGKAPWLWKLKGQA